MSDNNKKKILVVDDEPNVRESLRMILSREYAVDVAEDGEKALELLLDKGEESESCDPDLILLDLVMPGIDGIGLLEKIQNDFPGMPVVMLTATKTVKSAVQAMKIGAVDYLTKPYDVDELLSLIEETLREGASGRTSPQSVTTRTQSRPNMPKIDGDYGCMVGQQPTMAELYEKIDQLAKRDTTVLITGESGTGKELVAKEIHNRSNRVDGPFVAINCAAIPETLIESELFGHEKGSFTHAVEQRVGHFELANGGTLFLDEIGELSLPVQVKMLRFLQEQEFYRVGKSTPIQVDVRILAATNRSLEEAVKQGSFREDLFYRINVVALDMPPLRDRVGDIRALIDFFVKRMSPMYADRNPVFTDEAITMLEGYAWPGNVRELENVTESILALCSKNEIGVEDIPSRIRQPKAPSDLKQSVLEGKIPFEEAEKAFETDLIVRALKQTNYVQTRAAELLGISRRILKYKMDKLGISDTPSAEIH